MSNLFGLISASSLLEDNIDQTNSDYENIKSISKFIATQRAFSSFLSVIILGYMKRLLFKNDVHVIIYLRKYLLAHLQQNRAELLQFVVDLVFCSSVALTQLKAALLVHTCLLL